MDLENKYWSQKIQECLRQGEIQGMSGRNGSKNTGERLSPRKTEAEFLSVGTGETKEKKKKNSTDICDFP